MLSAIMMALAIQTTTTCNTFGGTTTCNTPASPPNPWSTFNAARDGAAEARYSAERAAAASEERRDRLGYYPECASRLFILAGCSRRSHDEAVAAIAAEAAAKELRSRTLDVLAAGDCQGAVKLALEGRDLALAREVRSFCQP